MNRKDKWWTVQFIPHGKGDIRSYKVKFLPLLIVLNLVLLVTVVGVGMSFFLWSTAQKMDARIDEQQSKMDDYINENEDLKLKLSYVNVELTDLQNNLLDLQRYIEEVQQLEHQIKELDDFTSFQPNEEYKSEKLVLGISSMDDATPTLKTEDFSALATSAFRNSPLVLTSSASTSSEITASELTPSRLLSPKNTLSEGTPSEIITTLATTDQIREQIIALKEEARIQQSQLADLIEYIEEEQYKALFIPSIPPSNGRITSSFGYRKDPFHGRLRMHNGIDFASYNRSPIYATAHGTVTAAGRNGNYGNQVVIDHGNGYTTSYSHLASYSVEIGDEVEKGDEIGKMGRTGRSTGVHLHYEIHKDGEPINPISYLKGGK